MSLHNRERRRIRRTMKGRKCVLHHKDKDAVVQGGKCICVAPQPPTPRERVRINKHGKRRLGY